jgi:hypothetical protein
MNFCMLFQPRSMPNDKNLTLLVESLGGLEK